MRLRKLTLRSITRFREPVEVDFEALGEGLVAIAGRNGEGKTTCLEAPFAALHLEFPTRPGGIYGVAHGKDARIELEVSNGQPYRCVVAVDAIRQTSEAYLFNGDGQPVNPSGKLREYGAAIAERFGSPRLMLSAALSCQTKRGSFLDLTKSERKDLLAEILDTAGLQRLAEAARERAKAAELALERARGAVAAGEGELATLPAHDLEALQLAASQAGDHLAMLRAALEAARERYATLEAERRQLEERSRAAVRLRDERDEGLRRVTAVTQRLADLEREEKAAAESSRRQREQLEAQSVRLPKYEQAERDLADARAALSEHERRVVVARLAVEEARADHHRLEREANRAETVRTRLADARRRQGLLDQVPCTQEPEWVGSHSGSTIDLGSSCRLLDDARRANTLVAQLVDEAQALTTIPQQLEAAGERWRRADEALHLEVQALEEARGTERALAPVAAQAPVARLAAKQIAELAAQDLGRLTGFERTRQNYQQELARLEERQRTLEAEIEATPMPDQSKLDAELAGVAAEGRELRIAVASAEQVAVAADRQLTRAEADTTRRELLTGQLAELRASLGQLTADLADWRTLERAFGRDGIQALEIDAAGPELSSLANELLTSCFGPRFELAFVTQALKADGKGQKEVFDVQVIDHDRGREGAVDSLSGGEKTIVSEAISLALAIYVGRHSGRRYETLFRDETAGQLDPDNAQRYVAMLRRARVLAGAHQVLFIAQQPEVWQQADAVLWCEGGRVEVRA